MNETLEYLQTFARFPFALHKFLQHRLTVDQAKQIVRERMERRDENFLRIVETSVYGYPHSPYLPLLKMAGCELGDLCALVKHQGLENALRQLRAAGVYITFEEFKGRKPIIRNGTTIPVTSRDFDNPFAQHHYTLQTGGSTGLSMQVNQALDFVAASAPHQLVLLSAHGMLNQPTARWGLALPADTLEGFFQQVLFNQPARRWFTPTGWRDSRYWYKYSPATLYLVTWARILGASIPFPKVVLPDQAIIVAKWMREMLDRHGHCLLFTSVSRAVRVCLAAEQTGFNLSGALFRAGGEPLTPGKASVIQRTGARVTTSYASAEAGAIGLGCARADDPSDVHFLHDAFALITHPYPVPHTDMTVPAFNLTMLLDSTPKIMLNLQYDDYGIIEERHCGCEFDACGYTTHLREIRSYSKLVGEGATLIGNDMIQIIEQILPERFGGSPLDYQLMEQENEQGLVRLYLLIHPRIEIADENQVLETIYHALSNSSPMADAARTVWQPSQTIQIKRQIPLLTAGGKLMPLYIHRK